MALCSLQLSLCKLSLLLLLSTNAVVTAETINGDWYTRYESYPPYCSTPPEMATRAIPPLQSNEHLGETRLAHVTAVIRHGARTPYSSKEKCWDGYWDPAADTAVWNCGLTTFLAPPTPRVINQEEGVYGSESDAMFLFEKKYDALTFPQHNGLNGTCQQGQLLLQGYDQELKNGEYLRTAYVYDGVKNAPDHDIRLRLLDLNDQTNRPYQEPLLKYRADDDQRTLMSGQILLRGMFGTEFVEHTKKHGQHPIIPLHVADRPQDVLACNFNECPRLATLYQRAIDSLEFKAFNNSQESKTMRKFIKAELGSLESPLDCLMTTMCTDRLLPDAVNDYHHTNRRELHPGHNHHTSKCTPHSRRRELHPDHDEDGDDDDDDDDEDCDDGKYGTNLFERLVKYDIAGGIFPYLYNNAEFSKVGIGPLWAEIFEMITPIINGGGDRGMASNKLHVISGHDTTLIPLLASLGVWKSDEWPHYASMMLIEIHELVDGRADKSVYSSDFAFRLLYNGNVWTDRVEGCHKDHDLCDFMVLQTIMQPIAVLDRDCVADKIVTKSALVQHAQGLLNNPGGIFLFLLIVGCSACLGFFCAIWYLKKAQSRYQSVLDDSDGIAMISDVRYRDNPEDDSDEAPTNLVI